MSPSVLKLGILHLDIIAHISDLNTVQLQRRQTKNFARQLKEATERAATLVSLYIVYVISRNLTPMLQRHRWKAVYLVGQ